MTRRISLVAVCCSSVSVNSRLRASSSWNRRTFSIAITAWSAKVLSELDLLARGKAPVSTRAHRDRPRWRRRREPWGTAIDAAEVTTSRQGATVQRYSASA